MTRGLPRVGAGDSLVFTAAQLSAGAAAIHFAVAKMHFDEYTPFGCCCAAGDRCSCSARSATGRSLRSGGSTGSGGCRLGPEHWKPDPIGFGDSAASAFDALLVLGCIALLVRRRGGPLSRVSALVVTLAVVAVTTLSLLSVLGLGSSFLAPTE